MRQMAARYEHFLPMDDLMKKGNSLDERVDGGVVGHGSC